MIYFLNASGGVAHCMPESVYQGSAEGNRLFLVSPHAASTEVGAAFRLPDGSVTPRYRLEYAGALNGYSAENGGAVRGWKLSLPASVTAQYGTVRVQFYFRSAGQGQEASASAQFAVERGVPSELPSAPEADAYADIVAALTALRADLINGYYPARAAVAWSDGHVYGANELVYYPAAGASGALVRSKIADNVQPPFADGILNAQYWEIAVDFDTIADDYFADVQAERAAAQAAQAAAETAQSAAEAAEESAQSYSASAAQSAGAASGSASQATAAATQAAGSASAAGQSAVAAAAGAEAAAQSAGSASGSAQSAQEYMEQARRYAQKEYVIRPSLGELPNPGDSAFIYLVPSASGTTGDDAYAEYLWISEDARYEYIGTVNDVDLSNYAQIGGTYPDMTVGNAANAANAASADSATMAAQDGDGNDIASTYARQTGNYPNLIAGKATESNGNLFYNGDFRLNTLGQTEYVDNSNEYFDCVDGWEFGYGDCTLEVLPAGGVQITKESGETNPTNFHTVDIRDAISHAGEYTVSFKVDSLSSVQQVYGYYIPQGSSAVYLTMTAKNDAENNIAIRTFTLTEEQVSAIRQSTRLVIGIQKAASVESMVIYWAKLEEGETSTAPNGIANNATKSLYAEKAAEAERAARADMLGTTQQIRTTSAQIGWWKIGEVDINNLPTSYSSYSLIMLVNGIHESQFASDNQAESGIVELDVRKDSGALVSNNCGVSILSGNLNSSDFCIVANGTTVTLYANIPNIYGTVDFVVINETAENNPGNRYFVFDAAFSAASAPGGAVYAVNRNKAEYDGDGNGIAATYATKGELNAGLQKLYPVGSIYLSANGTNPATLFGFGTWQAWGAGRVPVGVDASQTEFDAAEKTGGEKEHTLTIGEMPEHNHFVYRNAEGDSVDDTFVFMRDTAFMESPYQAGSTSDIEGLSTANRGGGAAHNNLQPYIACYMWKRTA